MAKHNAVLRGKNLELVKEIRFQGSMECSPKETPVLEHSSDTLRFNIPSGNKGTVRMCVVTEDGQCHGTTTLTYGSQPTCTALQPRNTWASGGRKIRVLGNNLRFVDAVLVHPSLKQITLNSSEHTWFHTLSQRENMAAEQFSVSIKMGNSTVDCVDKLSYLPDPEFLSFSTSKVDSDVQVTIQKTADSLNMSNEEVIVRGLQEEKQFECVIDNIKSTAITCKILGQDQTEIRIDSLKIMVGNFTKQLEIPQSGGSVYIVVILLIVVLFGAFGAVESDAEWIDGFQTSPPSHSYLLVNVKAGPAVVVLRMEKSRSKLDMVRSLQGAELQCCAGKARRKLLSSSAVVSSGSPVLWAGIFTAQEPHDPQNTALALYDLSQTKDQVPSHFSCSPDCTDEEDFAYQSCSKCFQASNGHHACPPTPPAYLRFFRGDPEQSLEF
ncbi:hypothetical protein NFI96_002830, partial [Prochilodus magdalenae]